MLAEDTRKPPPAEDTRKPLRDDVRRLGTLLGETLVRQEGEDLYRRVERVRASAKEARRGAFDGAFDDLAEELASMPLDAAVPVARAFSQFLHLANVAEQHHRVRRRRTHQLDPLAGPQPRSLEDTLPRLASAASPARLREAVLGLKIELVMTAHPTEMMRRTLQRKYNAIAARSKASIGAARRRSNARRWSRRCGARSRRPGRPRRCAGIARPPSTRCARPWQFSSTRSGTPFPSTCGRWTGRSSPSRGAACRSTWRRFASVPGLAAIATGTRRSLPR